MSSPLRHTKPAPLESVHPFTESPRVGPLNIVQGLHGLWAAHVISQDTFCLGVQVCQRMRATGKRHAIYTGTMAQESFTILHETLYTGPISKTLASYVNALQELHTIGGVLSYLILPDSELRKTSSEHFTLSPELHAGKEYGFNSLISFQVEEVKKEDYFARINALAAEHLGQCRALHIEAE